MFPKLVPACQTRAEPNAVVVTNSDRVRAAQQQVLEYLLLNHPLDCSICDQAGECYLQDYTYRYGRAHSRLREPKIQRLDKHHIGEQIALFTDRCVMCTRCVRFTREISGTAELQIINRGSVEEIDVFPGQPCNNKLAGNVVDLCPVGALCSKDFLYKKRVWWLKSAPSVCIGCSTGCSIWIDQQNDQVYRIRPRENPSAQGHFICDDGRFGWKYIQTENRLTAPRSGRTNIAEVNAHGAGSMGREVSSAAMPSFADPWGPIISAVRTALNRENRAQGSTTLGVLSPFMTCEEAYLLCALLRARNPTTVLTLGPIPIEGEDDFYPKGPRGEPPAENRVRFTIRAEKCPNRRGVSAIVNHFQQNVLTWEACLEQLERGSFTTAYVVGGYPSEWASPAFLKACKGLELLVVHDILRSPLSDAADFVLAAASFAEREGTVINQAGLAQSLQIARRPPGEAWPDGRILQELSGRKGLFQPRKIRAEIARIIAPLARFGDGLLSAEGIQVL